MEKARHEERIQQLRHQLTKMEARQQAQRAAIMAEEEDKTLQQTIELQV
jgi:hypothetical protein